MPIVALLVLFFSACNGGGNNESVSSQSTSDTFTGAAILSWVAPIENTDGTSLQDLEGFIIYYGETRDDLNSTVEVDDQSATVYEFQGLKNNTTYYFSITAYNTSGIQSGFSTIVSKFIE